MMEDIAEHNDSQAENWYLCPVCNEKIITKNNNGIYWIAYCEKCQWEIGPYLSSGYLINILEKILKT